MGAVHVLHVPMLGADQAFGMPDSSDGLDSESDDGDGRHCVTAAQFADEARPVYDADTKETRLRSCYSAVSTYVAAPGGDRDRLVRRRPLPAAVLGQPTPGRLNVG